MDALAANDVISLWERGRRASAHARALLLMAHAQPELSPAQAAALPLGRRDAALARLRRVSYGAVAPAFLECPRCAEGLEFAIDLDALLALAPGEGRGEPSVHRLVRPPRL